MRLERLAKDEGSGKSGCPTVYVDEAGALVVQGDLVDSETFEQLENVLPGESAVRIKPAVVAEALRRYGSRTGDEL